MRIHASQIIDENMDIVDVDMGRGEFWPVEIPNSHNAIQMNWGLNHVMIDFDSPREALEWAAKIIEYAARRI